MKGLKFRLLGTAPLIWALHTTRAPQMCWGACDAEDTPETTILGTKHQMERQVSTQPDTPPPRGGGGLSLDPPTPPPPPGHGSQTLKKNPELSSTERCPKGNSRRVSSARALADTTPEVHSCCSWKYRARTRMDKVPLRRWRVAKSRIQGRMRLQLLSVSVVVGNEKTKYLLKM